MVDPLAVRSLPFTSLSDDRETNPADSGVEVPDASGDLPFPLPAGKGLAPEEGRGGSTCTASVGSGLYVGSTAAASALGHGSRTLDK